MVTLGLALLLIGAPTWREHKRNKRAMEIVAHKEKEAERLAEDNRRYREVYLARLGVPEEVLKLDRLDSEHAAQERAEEDPEARP